MLCTKIFKNSKKSVNERNNPCVVIESKDVFIKMLFPYEANSINFIWTRSLVLIIDISYNV